METDDQGLVQALTSLLNKCNMENESNTPDRQLAEYMLGCLALFNKSTRARDAWFGIKLRGSEGRDLASTG